jgi:hypothetical protein
VQQQHRVSGLMLANHTSIQALFRKILSQYDKLRSKKAFINNYTPEPIFADGLEEFDSSREVVQSLVDESSEAFSGDQASIVAAAVDLENQIVATHTDIVGQLNGINGARLLASILIAEARHALVFADLAGCSTAVVDAPPADTVAALVALQEKLRQRLLRPAPGAAQRPKAVVAVEANDLGQAIAEAVAAVEAMA